MQAGSALTAAYPAQDFLVPRTLRLVGFTGIAAGRRWAAGNPTRTLAVPISCNENAAALDP
jgi:hypothetical protein